MAKIKGNFIMENVRGMIAKQVVFKRRLGTSYVAGPPNINENRVVKTEEQKNRNKFSEAVEFGKYAVQDPQLKMEYAALAKPGQTAYNVAVSDARLPPKINSILTQGYTGQIGSCILIQATDNIKVKRVNVTIYNADSTFIEQGDATDNGDNVNWIFSATIFCENIKGCVVEVKAFDIAGNMTLKTA